MQINFTKMTGAGNDFILVDNRDKKLTVAWEAFAMRVCDRRYGIGADGLLVVESSSQADFAMLYYNADGSYGGMCGNGGRCIARFVASGSPKRSFSFEALGFTYHADVGGPTVVLSMKQPTDVRLDCTVDLNGISLVLDYVNTGSPHVVLHKDRIGPEVTRMIEREGLESVGRRVRRHAAFQPEGTNVNLVEVLGPGSISMRTYERGVEAETLACGTGAVACSVITALRRQFHSPLRVTTSSNETLLVHFSRNGEQISEVRLEGPAERVFEGVIDYDPGSKAHATR